MFTLHLSFSYLKQLCTVIAGAPSAFWPGVYFDTQSDCSSKFSIFIGCLYDELMVCIIRMLNDFIIEDVSSCCDCVESTDVYCIMLNH